MGLLDWFRRRRSGPFEPYCRGCVSRDNEIKYLREHVDKLLDRVMAVAGLYEAQKDALATPLVEENTPPPPESEAEAIAREEHDQELIFDQSRKELERVAEEHGKAPDYFADA